MRVGTAGPGECGAQMAPGGERKERKEREVREEERDRREAEHGAG